VSQQRRLSAETSIETVGHMPEIQAAVPTGEIQQVRFHCRELETRADYKAAFPVMKELYALLDKETYDAFIKETVPEKNQLFGLYEGERLLTVVSTHKVRLIDGRRILWIFHMVTRAEYRSRGCGKQLIEYVQAYAKVAGYDELRVHSLSHRKKAHSFYEAIANMPEMALVFGQQYAGI